MLQKTVFILQFPEDIDEYEKNRNAIQGNHVLIAATPDACWELEKRNIPFRGIEEYTDYDELYSQGTNNYKILDQLCSTIDEVLQKYNPILKKYGLNPTLDNYHYNKILLDNLTFRISIIQSIVLKENPDTIITFSSDIPQKTIWNPHDSPFGSTENVYNTILTLKGWGCNIRQLKRPPFSYDKKNQSLKYYFISNLKKGLNHYPWLFIPLFSLKNFGFVKTLKIILYQCRNAIRNDKSLFLLRQEPSWSGVIFLLYQQGYQVVYLPEKFYLQKNDSVLDPATKEKIADCIVPFARYKNIDFFDILYTHFLITITTYIQYVPLLINNIEKEISKYHPIAFLCSEKSSIIEHIYSHIAHYHNNPVLVWQHGDGPFFPPMQMYVELMNSDIHLSYGPGHQKMLNAALKNHSYIQIESVGSYSLEKLSQITPGRSLRKKIIYVTSMFYYNYMYQNVHPPNDNQMWNFQKKILMTLGNSTIPTYFKITPGLDKPPFFYEYITMNHFTNITTIWQEKTFSELLKDSDIVICDLANTPVIEAIAAHKTIFVLLNNSKYLRREALDLLKKRVYWSEDIDEFVQLISDYLQGKPIHQHPDKNNTEYLEMFGVHKLDGKVVERAINIIERETHSCSK